MLCDKCKEHSYAMNNYGLSHPKKKKIVSTLKIKWMNIKKSIKVVLRTCHMDAQIHTFSHAKYDRKVPKCTHTQAHSLLKSDNKFGSSSTVHYARTDPGGWSALSSSAVVPVSHRRSWTMKLPDFKGRGKSDFKGWTGFTEILAQCDSTTTRQAEESVRGKPLPSMQIWNI